MLNVVCPYCRGESGVLPADLEGNVLCTGCGMGFHVRSATVSSFRGDRPKAYPAPGVAGQGPFAFSGIVCALLNAAFCAAVLMALASPSYSVGESVFVLGELLAAFLVFHLLIYLGSGMRRRAEQAAVLADMRRALFALAARGPVAQADPGSPPAGASGPPSGSAAGPSSGHVPQAGPQAPSPSPSLAKPAAPGPAPE